MSRVRLLAALAAVAGLGIVAAMMSSICSDGRPAARRRRFVSGRGGVGCRSELFAISSQDGWRGILVLSGFWNVIPARASLG